MSKCVNRSTDYCNTAVTIEYKSQNQCKQNFQLFLIVSNNGDTKNLLHYCMFGHKHNYPITVKDKVLFKAAIRTQLNTNIKLTIYSLYKIVYINIYTVGNNVRRLGSVRKHCGCKIIFGKPLMIKLQWLGTWHNITYS